MEILKAFGTLFSILWALGFLAGFLLMPFYVWYEAVKLVAGAL